ncbi:hypothetical protein L6164_008537 [Bauhinia variegata]|uniref:Uncharacterized protein n=1 Tax=Bauhinia variegata TaxID=167791 RepID=A0ACB9PIH1_BAUVA|nr:hypothetical protein L6164_008537 [Bauhinia variegata]
MQDQPNQRKEEMKHVFLEPRPKQPRPVFTLYFNGSPSNPKGGAWIVLINSEKETLPFAYQLPFSCTNNEAGCEALILGLQMAKEVGATNLLVKGDSNLVVKQVNKEYKVKEPSLLAYKERVQELIERFPSLHLLHAPRVENKIVDVLATLGSKLPKESQLSLIVYQELVLVRMVEDKGTTKVTNWRKIVEEQIKGNESLKIFKEFYLRNGRLYKKSS